MMTEAATIRVSVKESYGARRICARKPAPARSHPAGRCVAPARRRRARSGGRISAARRSATREHAARADEVAAREPRERHLAERAARSDRAGLGRAAVLEGAHPPEDERRGGSRLERIEPGAEAPRGPEVVAVEEGHERAAR